MNLRDIVMCGFTTMVIMIFILILGIVFEAFILISVILLEAPRPIPDPFAEYQNRFEGLDSWCSPRSSRWVLKDISTNTCIIGCDTQTTSKELGPFPCVN